MWLNTKVANEMWPPQVRHQEYSGQDASYWQLPLISSITLSTHLGSPPDFL
jgi:hypothetical protein